MADEQKPKPEKQVENLELNKETVQDLTEEQAEKAEGGLRQCTIAQMTIQSCFCTIDFPCN